MGKKGFEYEIRGYRYAPESFRAFKGLPGQKMEQIPLSDEQRQKMGYLCLTQGGKAGMAYVKRIERERARKCHYYKTYGFFSKTNRTGMCIAPAFGAGRAILQRHDWISCASIGSIWPRPAGVSNRVRNVSLTNISAQFMCGKIMWLPI